jgi:hypothetical protein
MELTGWFVIVPLALAALLTGLVMSLITPWGLFRHYWVLIALGGCPDRRGSSVAVPVLIRRRHPPCSV